MAAPCPLLPRSPALAPFAGREQISPEAKPAIGRAAGAMIQTGQVVFLDGGTTAVQLARQLPRELRATVVTHSPSIAVELVNHPSIEVLMLGGRLYKHSIVGVGAATVEAIGRIRATCTSWAWPACIRKRASLRVITRKRA